MPELESIIKTKKRNHVTNSVTVQTEKINALSVKFGEWIETNKRVNSFVAFGGDGSFTAEGLTFYEISSQRAKHYCNDNYRIPINPENIPIERTFFPVIKFQNGPSGTTCLDLTLDRQKYFLRQLKVPSSKVRKDVIATRVEEAMKVLRDPLYIPVQTQITSNSNSHPRRCGNCDIPSEGHICRFKIRKLWEEKSAFQLEFKTLVFPPLEALIDEPDTPE